MQTVKRYLTEFLTVVQKVRIATALARMGRHTEAKETIK